MQIEMDALAFVHIHDIMSLYNFRPLAFYLQSALSFLFPVKVLETIVYFISCCCALLSFVQTCLFQTAKKALNEISLAIFMSYIKRALTLCGC